MVTQRSKRLTGLNPLSYLGSEPLSPPQLVIEPRDPTANDIMNFNVGTIWIVPGDLEAWILVSKAGNVATWVNFVTDIDLPLDVEEGGTGAASFTDHSVLVGSGTDPITAIPVGVTGTVLIGLSGMDPEFSATPTVTSITITDAPVNGTDGANKDYVDTIAGGFTPVPSGNAASTADVNAVYANGAAGVGATLTNNGAMVAFTLDGVTLVVGNRVLIKDQTNTFENGIYTVTVVGDGVTNWVLTRATNFDTPAEVVQGALVAITQGVINGLTSWVQTEVVANIGVDAILWSLFSTDKAISNYTNVNTTPYIALATDDFLSVDCSGMPITIQLPDVPVLLKTYYIKDRTGNAATNNITVTTVSGVTLVDGVTSYTMNTDYQSINCLGNSGVSFEIF